MSSRFTAQSGKGVLFVALALVAALLVPSVYTWAVKPGNLSTGSDSKMRDPGDLKQIDPDTLAYFRRIEVEPQARPLKLSPLGDNFTPNIPPVNRRKGLVYTPAGFFNPKDPRSLDILPADLRGSVDHPAPNGKGIGLGNSVGIIQVSEEALSKQGYQAIEAAIKAVGGRVLGAVPERGFIVQGRNPAAMAELTRAAFVEASMPFPDGAKIDPQTGRQTLLDRVRGTSNQLEVRVSTWDPEDTSEALKHIKGIVGPDNASLLEGGRGIHATATTEDLKKIARLDKVASIEEVPEYSLAAYVFAEHPPTVQVGENEHTGDAVPFWDAKVDGGGCGNAGTPPGNTDTTRCGSAVPPVVVAILDNGASLDAATMVHSTSVLPIASTAALVTGNNHRKIRSYQEVNDSPAGSNGLGSTCDAVLSGGQSHGNVIAGMIAGNASALGYVFSQKRGPVRLLNLDGAAHGARLTIQDAGNAGQCVRAEVVERGSNVTPGNLTTRMDAAYATGARLHVMPFGSPNWTSNGATGTTAAGTYGAVGSDAYNLDSYLANDLEYQVFVPVGNRGLDTRNGNALIPDLFDAVASAADDPTTLGPNPSFVPIALQMSNPATAKNIVAVGSVCEDVQTTFGNFNEEENPSNYTAKGPATAASLRAAPMMIGVGNDRTPSAPAPEPYGMYTVKSTDNNQDGPIGTEIDEQSRGTSFGTASVASVATLIEDYFHQGFYPTGDRIQGDRVPNVSGAAVKAMLAASSNFLEQTIGVNERNFGMDGNDPQVATTRGSVLCIASPCATPGNSIVYVNPQQGYGRPIASQILPLSNWPNVDVGDPDTLEKPAIGLVVWDGVIGADTVEPPINNGDVQHDHHFRVLSTVGQIRACLAYPDPPGENMINDLDLELINPAGLVYDGNVYNPLSQIVGQWGLSRGGGDTDQGDRRNPLECVHLTDNPDRNAATSDNQLVTGLWTLRVKKGPGAISLNTGADEDGSNGTTANNRLDQSHCSGTVTIGCRVDSDCPVAQTCVAGAGRCTVSFALCTGGPGQGTCAATQTCTLAEEDLDGDGLLDKNGQVYAAVVAGPLVVEKDGSNLGNYGDFPQSIVKLNNGIRYNCSDDVVVQVLDTDATAASLSASVKLEVFNAAAVLVDSETNLTFGGSGNSFASEPIAVRLGTGNPAVGTANNGILEGDTGYSIVATHTDPTANSRTAIARAPMSCEPNFLAGGFTNPGQRDVSDLIFGGCDRDQFFDKNELVNYSIAVINNSIVDEFTDVIASLTACAVPFAGDGSCATPSTVLTILDTPKNIGRLPAGQAEAVNFSIKVSATPTVQGPKVFLRLALAQTNSGPLINRAAFTFEHGMQLNRSSLHYSTDLPNGGTPTGGRDLNRNLVIDPNDSIAGGTLGLLDETITFSSLFTPVAGQTYNAAAINNLIAAPGTCNQHSTNPGAACATKCTGGVDNGAACVTNADCTSPGFCDPEHDCTGTDPLRRCGDEPYPALGIFDGTQDTNSNGVLDRHVLTDSLVAGVDQIPWDFDSKCNGGANVGKACILDAACPGSTCNQRNGGFFAVRDPSSNRGNSTSTHPAWHYVRNGTCGFQTQNKANCLQGSGKPGNNDGGPCVDIPAGLTTFVGGVWHTGSGVTGTCGGAGGSCYLDSDCTGGNTPPCVGGADNPECTGYGFPFDPATARKTEYLFDYIISPVIEKVNQGLDANGFPFTVEFQRLGYNQTNQLRSDEPYYYILIDNNIDTTTPNSIPDNGAIRGDGVSYFFRTGQGPVTPAQSVDLYNQETFGPLTDPDASITTGPPDVTGDESGFAGMDADSVLFSADHGRTNPIPQAPVNLRPFPGYPNAVTGVKDVSVGEDTIAGPSRSIDFDLVDYEDGAGQFFEPGDAGNRFQIGMAFGVVEARPADQGPDYGFGLDDIVLEWDEVHPATEATAACDKVGGTCSNNPAIACSFTKACNNASTNRGQQCVVNADCPSGACVETCGAGNTCIPVAGQVAAGHKCSTLSVDRTNLYDCNESLQVTVNDSRYADGTLGNAVAQDTIQVNAWSDSEAFPGEVSNLLETGNATGIFTGTVLVSGIFNSPGSVFVVPGLEADLFVAYEDNQCDANHNGIAGQSGFNNLDGDGLVAAAGRDGICGTNDDQSSFFGPDGACGAQRHCSGGAPNQICASNAACGVNAPCNAPSIDDTGDNCALAFNPGQQDDDGDHVGNTVIGGIYVGCDNCPFVYNPDQADSNADGVGDACDYDDVDSDGVPNDVDNCPDVFNPTQTAAGGSTRGNACKGNATHCSVSTTLFCSVNGDCPGGETCIAGCPSNLPGPAGDCDGDGVNNGAGSSGDNCVATANAGQGDSDSFASNGIATNQTIQPLGDLCDGDCFGTCVGGGSNGKQCRFDSTNKYGLPDSCPGGSCKIGHCSITIATLCNTTAECGAETCVLNCSNVNDDLDDDHVRDSRDDCPLTYNPSIVAGASQPIQADVNFNGIGDVCDPAGYADENRDGIPEDVAAGPFFGMAVSCRNIPLAQLVVLSAIVRDRAELSICTGTCNTGTACTGGPGQGTCAAGQTCSTLTNTCRTVACTGGPGQGTCAAGQTCSSISTTACTNGPNVGRACTVPGVADPACIVGNTCAVVNNSCGDGDAFGDPGERIRLGLFLQNLSGFSLTGVSFSLSTADPDIQCINDALITVPVFANNEVLDTKDLNPASVIPAHQVPADDPANPTDGRFFELTINPTTQTTNAASAARANLVLTMTSNEVGGTTTPVPITTLLDLDIPPGAIVAPTDAKCDPEGGATSGTYGTVCGRCVAGACTIGLAGACTSSIQCADNALCGGAAGSCRPGLVFEDFESPGGASVPCGSPICENNDFTNTIGYIEKNAAADSAVTMVGVPCFGFLEFFASLPLCQIDPDFDTDWHFEQPAPTGTQPKPKAFHGNNSAHWGRHTSTNDRAGDTTGLREIEAFETNPINLTILPGAGDLQLSFYHIIALEDDNAVNFAPGTGSDHGDVQIQTFDHTACNISGAPCTGGPGQGTCPVGQTCNTDVFNRWLKLQPFQNVYDHLPMPFSQFGGTYCEFTPSDAADGSNPGVYGETMCFPQGVWSHSGAILGNNPFDFFNAQGPGFLGSQGEGTWVQSKFDLSLFIGQRVKIRWVGESWAYANNWDSYLEPPGAAAPFDTQVADDGWWIDQIRITGGVTAPVLPAIEAVGHDLTAQCPDNSVVACGVNVGCNNCNELAAGTDHGFVVTGNFKISDADGDGVVVQGETLLLDSSQVTNPGGCADGVAQFRFTKDPGGTLLQDWSTASSIKLGNTADGDVYSVQVRCSSDFTCTTAATSPPVGQAACAPPGIRVYTGVPPPPASAISPAPNPVATFAFGTTGCASVPGNNSNTVCFTQHNFLHGINPLNGAESCFAVPPPVWANAFMSTAPVHRLVAATPWSSIPAAGASCTQAIGPRGTCDMDTPGPLLVVAPGPVPTDTTCGDNVVPTAPTVAADSTCSITGASCTGGPGQGTCPASNTCNLSVANIAYYMGAYATTASGAACTTAGGAAVPANIDIAGAFGCYHLDQPQAPAPIATSTYSAGTPPVLASPANCP